MWRFYAGLVDRDENVLVYDITSLSSYAKGINWLEYGDDFRKLDLPQVNLGLVVSLDRRVPIYSKLFPGSVNDVSTLKDLVADVRELGVKECLFIPGSGFLFPIERRGTAGAGHGLRHAVAVHDQDRQGLDSGSTPRYESGEHARRFGSDIYHVIEKEVQIGDASIFAYVLFNKKREAEESTSFFNRLMDIESKLEGKRVYGDAFDHFERARWEPQEPLRMLHLGAHHASGPPTEGHRSGGQPVRQDDIDLVVPEELGRRALDLPRTRCGRKALRRTEERSRSASAPGS